MHSEQYEREGEAFLRRIITTDETWAKLMNRNWKPIKWLRYEAARVHLEQYEREGEAFL